MKKLEKLKIKLQNSHGVIKKKKVRLFLIVTVIFFCVFFALHENVKYDSYNYKFQSIDCVLTNEDVSYVDGYSVDGNNYILQKDAGVIKFNSPIEAGSIKINLKLLNKKKAELKFYYASEEGRLSEAKTLLTSVVNNEGTAIFNIPSESENQSFMIQVGDSFCLESFEISSHHAELEKVESSTTNYIVFSVIDLIISSIISIIITVNNYLFKAINKLKHIIRYERKKYAIRILLYISSVILLLGFQVFFTNQFIANINGTYVINIMRLSFSIMLVTLFWGIIWLRKNFKSNIEKIFLLISLSVGITYAIATPMLQESTWDAGIHYGNTIELVYVDQDKLPGLDKNVGWLEYSYNLNDLNDIQDKYNTNYYYDRGMVNTRDWSIVNIYNSLGYIPHAIGIFIARGLSLSFTTSILFGKIFSSICYSMIVYFAMKRLNTGKLVMFILALYPTALLLAGTYSYDTWVTAWIFLGLAYLFANIQEKDRPISRTEIFIIPFSLFIAVGPKAIYFPIMLLCYLMPKCKFNNKKDRYLYYSMTTGFMFLTMISFILPFIFGVSSGTEVGDTRGGADVNSSLQVRYVLSHPIEYAKTLILFLKNYWSFSNISDYTTNLAYIGQAQYSIVLVLVMIGTLLVGDKHKLEKNIDIKFKGFTILLVFGISALVASAFYVAYTAVGASFISGCQFRYVLPILFPIAYCLRNTFKPILIRKEYVNAVIISMSTLILIYTLFANIIMIYSIY